MIEILRPLPTQRPRLAVFDFDGTISLIRCGWQRIMSDTFFEVLRDLDNPESPTELRAMIDSYIFGSAGQPTNNQMAWVADLVAQRGGPRLPASEYRARYDSVMAVLIEQRLAGLRDGSQDPDSLLVPYVRQMLDLIQAADIPLALLSGTDREYLFQESKALGIDHYFGDRVYGPGAHDPQFSKGSAVREMMQQYGLGPGELISFGDGPVEAVATNEAGGVVIGVALDEEHGNQLDTRKRDVLVSLNASLITIDFREYQRLFEICFVRN
jgi:phosphoglycolate phosphatase